MQQGRNAQPPHDAVDWASLDRSSGPEVVRVVCPHCGEARWSPAKTVRYRINQGRFTGLCAAGAVQARGERIDNAPHPAVDWDSTVTKDGRRRVRVTCPVCARVRWLEAKTVRKQLRQGVFNGSCLKDRLIVRKTEFPEAPGVDWSDFEMVVEGAGRRRRMVRIHCPVCQSTRLGQASHLAESIRKGSFRPECPSHRKDPVLSARARRELLQLVRMVDLTIEELVNLTAEVAKTKPRRVAAS